MMLGVPCASLACALRHNRRLRPPHCCWTERMSHRYTLPIMTPARTWLRMSGTDTRPSYGVPRQPRGAWRRLPKTIHAGIRARFATLTPPSSIERVRLHARSHHPNAVKSACRTNPDRLPGADLVPERDGLRRVFARKPCPSGQDSRKSSSRNRDRATGTATDSLAKLAYAQLNPGWPPPHPGHFLCQISEPFAPYRWPHPPHSSS